MVKADADTPGTTSKVDPVASQVDGETADQPLTVGQLGMWVFISTEIMLFAAVITTYLIFRLSSLQSDWAGSSIMHVSLTIGIMNTAILVLSGFTAWAAHMASSEDRPAAAKLWLTATLLLGLAFLGVKSTEYYSKYKLGLMPMPGQKQLHEEADHQYLANVNKRLKAAIARLESEVSSPIDGSADPDPALQEELETLYSLKRYMADITSKHVGRTANSYHGDLSIRMMAWQIYPHPETGRNVEVVLEPEFQGLQRAISSRKERLELVQRRHEMVKLQILEFEKQLEPFRVLAPSGDAAAEFEKMQSWLETKQQQDQDLEIEERRLQSVLDPMQGRIENLMSSFAAEGEILGVNEREGLRLPVVIPNGQAWISCYLLLTGTHALHLIGGLFALLWWMPRKLNAIRAPALYVTCMYWQFVDAVWLALFWLIYF